MASHYWVLLPLSMGFDGHNLYEGEVLLVLEKYPKIDVRDHSFLQEWEGAHQDLNCQKV
jgi:hypothetical protein